MKIILNNITKKFGNSIIINELSYTFETNNAYWIAGANGSGKSTLLRIISGLLTPDKGEITYLNNKQEIIKVEDIYRLISYAAPYSEIIEEFTLKEMIEFHFKFKEKINRMSTEDLIQLTGLQNSTNKTLSAFSSGMKQKIKLLLAITSKSEILLLDEPSTNLDETAKKWYSEMIGQFKENRLIIVCSNNLQEEHYFCNQKLELGI